MAGHTKWSEIKRQKGVRDRPRYEATAERDGRFWLVNARELPGVRAQVRRLEEAEDGIRGAIALWLDVAPGSFDVMVTPAVGDEAR